MGAASLSYTQNNNTQLSQLKGFYSFQLHRFGHFIGMKSFRVLGKRKL